ncbi:MAG: TRAP transporter small permease subunit [Candidatus Latescibacterota bacterium]|nr:MAG: TRAP transporter small permease subunit [Candidatus Latescibacterota bacterium]
MERPFLIYILIATGILIAAIIRAQLKKRSRLTGFFRFTGGLEITFIALLLFALVFFGCLQIVLRNFYHRGIIWADPLMRHIVLWLGCLGAAFATTKMRHINIDVFTRLLPPKLLRIRNKIIFLATAIAASILGFAALKLVLDEKSFGEQAFLGVDIWLLQVVLPVAFFLIAYRSLLNMMVPPDVSTVDWDDFSDLENGGWDGSVDIGGHGAGDSQDDDDGNNGDGEEEAKD